MKINFDRADLLSQLQMVSRATATRSAVQALAGVLFKAQQGEVELAATDSEIGLRSKLQANVHGEGSILLPGRLVTEILRALDSDQVDMERVGDGGEVGITAGQARFGVRTLPSEDFPRLPELGADTQVAIPALTFAETVERVARAASKDETRPVLTGILVSVR